MILKNLNNLLHQRVIYQDEEYYISSNEINRGIVKLFTNNRTLVMSEEDFNIDDFQILSNEKVIAERRDKDLMPVTQTILSTNAAELTSVLLDNIEKIKQNPEYIPQADAINTQIKGIIDIAKTQIEAIKATGGL